MKHHILQEHQLERKVFKNWFFSKGSSNRYFQNDELDMIALNKARQGDDLM